jgi:protein TonB
LGLGEQARADLLASLPVHEGDELNADTIQKATQAAKAFDEHLIVIPITLRSTTSGVPEADLTIGLIQTAMRTNTSTTASSDAPRIKVGANVQSVMIVSKTAPVYPALAKAAGVSGVVQLAAIIGKDGTIQELHSLSGPPLLIQAAMDAVKQWVYRPTLLNGQPVTVETTIDINFTLAQ